MAAGDPHTGMGAILQQGDGGSPETFLDVVGIKSISGPSMSRDTHDTTDMAANDPYRTFVGGLVDPGEITFQGNFLPAERTQNQTVQSGNRGLLAEFDLDSCDSVRNWRIVLPVCEGDPEGTLSFSGVFTQFGAEIPMDDLMSFQGGIKISGRPYLELSS